MQAIVRSLLCVALAMLALAPVSNELHGAEAPHADAGSVGQTQGGALGTEHASDAHAQDHSQDPSHDHSTGQVASVAVAETKHADRPEGGGRCHPGLDCFPQAVVVLHPLAARAMTEQSRDRPHHHPVLTGTAPASDPPPPRLWS